ncbi:MAG: 6,7-dimethyl-8-ribityllumazine synthase, partial [Verrucomicrobia bacterium]|nr:6,7-dimethyl-8-ribityllumazine synthase [Verrucomicrobiota bacterium]
MSDQPFPTLPEVDTTPRRVAIVASQYNPRFTNALVSSAQEELKNILPNASVDVHRVPGAFEIPVVVEALCQASGVTSDKPDVIIA